ncbi:epoxide hydrolase [Gordonia sp. CPCC 206044]|uniref:epoxide hydrolase family protein n=1 Tax=Gordonia sp. CPCC 206044 TaxID=3140793 RepID=UPI003AF3421E
MSRRERGHQLTAMAVIIGLIDDPDRQDSDMATDTAPEPYEFAIDEAQIADLHARLDRTRWPKQIPGGESGRGVPVADARRFAQAWRELDMRSVQDEINRLAQFIVEIDGEPIHFVHRRSSRPDAVPLLLLHGWPGSVIEFLDIVPTLTEPTEVGHPAFHVVVPSHPGTGLGEPTTSSGWGVDRTARAYVRLMSLLGYARFVVQGGDHGAVIGPHLGRVAPDSVLGIHVNAATLGFMPFGPVDDDERGALSSRDLERLALIDDFLTDGNGYNVIQATRPQTIGYGLEDSPVALLTWMLEKFEAWTGDSRILDDARFRFLMLANISAYWFRRNATSTANNVYAEYRSLFADPEAFVSSGVPTAVLALRGDPSIRRFAERSNHIVQWSDVDAGGHFGALEAGDVLRDDLARFVTRVLAAPDRRETVAPAPGR